MPENEKDGPPVVTDSRCDCANTQGTHEIVCLYWPLSLNGAPLTPPVERCQTCIHPEGYDRLSGPCPTCNGDGVIPPEQPIPRVVLERMRERTDDPAALTEIERRLAKEGEA